ncbi:MAG: ROK family protein [Opitutales bacterium]|nr:ROK family protein [Opitutales bacterium]
MDVLGIDIGGSGIKGAVVDVSNGVLLGERYRVATPKPCTREALAEAVASVIRYHNWSGPVGCGYPGVVHRGVLATAANLDKSLIGMDFPEAVQAACGVKPVIVNDADAAGLAEMASGSGKELRGTVIMVTIGTGIGTALFYNGKLVPNTELGHLELHGVDSERLASETARKESDLSWKKWAKNLSDYLNYLHALFAPEMIILGGGGLKKQEKFVEYLDIQCPYCWAKHGNLAGIIGAAATGMQA